MKPSINSLRYINEGSGYPTSNWKLEGCQESTDALVAAYNAATGDKKQELYNALLFLNAFNAEQVNATPDPEFSPTKIDRSLVRRNDYMSRNDILNFAKTREVPEYTSNPEDALIDLIDLKREYEKQQAKKNKVKRTKKTQVKEGN